MSKNTSLTKVEMIKNDYISNSYSNKEIADKYNVHPTYISKLSKKYKWDSERLSVRHAVRAKTKEMLIDKISENLVTVEGLSDKLLIKIEQAIDELGSRCAKERHTVTAYTYNADGKKTKEDELIKECYEIKQADIIDASALNALTRSLRDLKEIKMLISDQDKREKEARIKLLEKQSAEDTTDRTIHVVLDDEVAKYGD